MHIPFPSHLHFTPVVLIAPEGGDPLAYARFLKQLSLHRHDESLAPVDRAVLDALALPDGAPECVEPEVGLAAIEDEERREALRAKTAELDTILREELPRLSDETDAAARVTALARAFAGLPAGTVVYDRRTDRTHVLFLMEHIQVGLRTGLHRWDGFAPAAPVPLVVRRGPHHAHSLGMAPDVVITGADRAATDRMEAQIKTVGLGALSCLAWGLPPPFGPFAAAGVSVVQILWGGDGSPTFGDELSKVTKAIADYIDANSIRSDAAELKAFATGMANKVTVLKTLGERGGEAEQTYYDVAIPDIISLLKGATEFNKGGAYKALVDLTTNYLENDAGLAMCVLAGTLHLLALKMIMQLQVQTVGWLSSQPDADSARIARATEEWLYSYTNFLVALGTEGAGGKDDKGVVEQAAVAILLSVQKRRDERKARFHPPVRDPDYIKQYVGYGGGAGGAAVPIVIAGAWYWQDGDETHYLPDTSEKSGCKTSWHEHRDVAQAEYEQHWDAAVAAFEAKYAYAAAAVAKWRGALSEWNQHRPPLKPAAAPTIDPQGWTGAPPPLRGAPCWAEGSTVSYAVAYVNASGPSEIGPYSEPARIQPATGATIELPADPLKMATRLRIHRRIITAQGTPIERVAAIVDAATTRWRDAAA